MPFNVTRCFSACLMAIWSIATVAMLFGSNGFAQDTEENKGIRVRPSDSAFLVTFKPKRSAFLVGQSLSFSVFGNKPFYLYLYTKDTVTGNTILLMPNERYSDNYYEAEKLHTVPDKNIELYSDSVGDMSITMLASTQALAIDYRIFNKTADFENKAELNNQAIESQFAGKGIRLRDADAKEQNPRQYVLEEVLLSIGDSTTQTSSTPEPPAAAPTLQPTPPANRDQAIVFVSTDNEYYEAGDTVRIIYGADRAGWVHLYAVGPDGDLSLLTRTQVTGNSYQQATAEASAPGGDHKLIAVYTENETFDDEKILNERLASKDLRLLDKTTISSSARSFWIAE